MAFQNIPRQSISEAIYDQFMDALLLGEWKPGDRIPSENELSKELNVSRISVRSALQKLAGLGLIESRQGEGTFVCEFSGAQCVNNLLPVILFEQSNMADLMEFRSILDTEVATLAASRASIEEISKLKENYKAHMKADNLQECAEYDAEFHHLLGTASHNLLLEQIFVVFKQVFQKNMYELACKMGASGARKYHDAIISAIESRDPKLARESMKKHIEDSIQNVMEDHIGNH